MPYFTAAEFRARYPELTAAAYPDATVEAYRAAAEEAIEAAAGVAFEPRTVTGRSLYLTRGSSMWLASRLRTVTAVTIDETALTASELTDLGVSPDGVVYDLPVTAGGEATVSYTHGYDAPPLWIKEAAMVLTKSWMVKGPVDERATQIATEDGPINLSTAGMRGATFGIPFVDAAVAMYAVKVYVG